ncbi:hypothetical protein ACI3ER_11990 [Bacillus sp. Wb]
MTESNITEKKFNDFIDDIVKVYEKHNMSIAHEDGHGAFIVEDLEEENIKWLKDAIKQFSK